MLPRYSSSAPRQSATRGREVDLSCGILLLVQDYAGLRWAIQAALEAGRAAWDEAPQEVQLVESYRHHIGERKLRVEKVLEEFRGGHEAVPLVGLHIGLKLRDVCHIGCGIPHWPLHACLRWWSWVGDAIENIGHNLFFSQATSLDIIANT